MTDWLPYRLVSGAPRNRSPRRCLDRRRTARTDYDSSFGDCFARGVQSATTNLPAAYLAMLPVCLVFFAVQMLQLVPVVRIVLPMMFGVVLNNALIGGVWRYFPETAAR